MTDRHETAGNDLHAIARECRKSILKMIFSAQSGHPGGAMSAVEILTALWFKIMRYDPKNPDWADRDRFVLSKGHAAPALYAALQHAGFFPAEHFDTFRRVGGLLQGHPDIKIPGVDMTAGSLGIGLSAACGMALGAKLTGRDFRVYCLIGDGEQDEGQIWEAALAAAQQKLDNLVVFADRNLYQNDGATCDIVRLSPLADKWRSFGWNVREIDGHDFDEIVSAVESAQRQSDRPTMLLARTTKGKGTSYSEGSHYHPPTPEQLTQALAELGEPSESRRQADTK